MKYRSWLFAVAFLAAAVSPLAAQAPSPKGLVPTKMWAAQTGEKTVTLTWTAPAGVTGYRVYRCSGMLRVICPASRILATLARNVSSAVYPIIGSGPVTYFIQAIGANGELGRAVAFNAVTPLAKGTVASIPPKSSSVTAAQTGNTITVTWQPVAGATAYAIGRAVAPYGYRSVCRLCPTETRFVDSVLTPNAKHTYAIAAITPTGVSRATISNVVTPVGGGQPDTMKLGVVDTTKAGIPVDSSKASLLPPSFFSAILEGLNARLIWNPDPKASGYTIYRSVGTGPFVMIARVESRVASFLDALGPIVGRIRYRIAAFDPKGASPFAETSIEKSATGKEGTKQ
jgi:hypothetical protein